MKDLAENLFGVLVICIQVTLPADKGNFREKLVTVARVHCQRKNADIEFSQFKESNTGMRFHAQFNFNSAFVA